MIVAIHQPQFLPWPRYFYKILRSDVFVLYDSVQFPRGKHFGNRNQIKVPTGPLWLTVPVLGRSDLLPYHKVEVDPSAKWKHKHARTLELAYARAPHYGAIIPALLELYQRESWPSIAELDAEFMRACFAAMGCKVSIVRASEMECVRRGTRGSDAIMAILEEVNATAYISGSGEGSKRYVDPQRFQEAGIELLSYDLHIPAYPQRNGQFIPDLSIVDLIANVGLDARRFIEGSGRLVSWVSV